MKPSLLESERRRRILISLWAYAYEFESDSLVTDAEFDQECKLVDPTITTDHAAMDKFFKEEFMADTGMWIHKHPELDKIKKIYERIKNVE